MINIEKLVEKIETKTNGDKIITYEYTNTIFEDSALRLPKEKNKAYFEKMIPGYIIVARLETKNKKQYDRTYHVSEDGNLIRMKEEEK